MLKCSPPPPSTHLAHPLLALALTFLGQRSLGALSRVSSPLPCPPPTCISSEWHFTYQVFSFRTYCLSPGVACKLLAGWGFVYQALLHLQGPHRRWTHRDHLVKSVQCSMNEWMGSQENRLECPWRRWAAHGSRLADKRTPKGQLRQLAAVPGARLRECMCCT